MLVLRRMAPCAIFLSSLFLVFGCGRKGAKVDVVSSSIVSSISVSKEQMSELFDTFEGFSAVLKCEGVEPVTSTMFQKTSDLEILLSFKFKAASKDSSCSVSALGQPKSGKQVTWKGANNVVLESQAGTLKKGDRKLLLNFTKKYEISDATPANSHLVKVSSDFTASEAVLKAKPILSSANLNCPEHDSVALDPKNATLTVVGPKLQMEASFYVKADESTWNKCTATINIKGEGLAEDVVLVSDEFSLPFTDIGTPILVKPTFKEKMKDSPGGDDTVTVDGRIVDGETATSLNHLEIATSKFDFEPAQMKDIAVELKLRMPESKDTSLSCYAQLSAVGAIGPLGEKKPFTIVKEAVKWTTVSVVVRKKDATETIVKIKQVKVQVNCEFAPGVQQGESIILPLSI